MLSTSLFWCRPHKPGLHGVAWAVARPRYGLRDLIPMGGRSEEPLVNVRVKKPLACNSGFRQSFIGCSA